MIQNSIISDLVGLTGIRAISGFELPIGIHAPNPKIKHGIGINIGPIEIDPSDADKIYLTCITIFHHILDYLKSSELIDVRIGVSIFIAPGSQSHRAMSGWIDVDEDFKCSSHRACFKDVYSNMKYVQKRICEEIGNASPKE